MVLGHAVEDIQHLPGHEPEVARILRDRLIGQEIEQAVENVSGGLLQEGLTRARTPPAVNHLGAAVHQGHHSRQKFRGILQIRIDDEDPLSAAVRQASGKGDLVAVVPGEIDAHHVGIGGRERAQQRPGGIGRPIVHQHDLIALGDGGASGGDPAVKLGDSFGLRYNRAPPPKYRAAVRGRAGV